MREWQKRQGQKQWRQRERGNAMAVAESVERGIGETLAIVTDRAWSNTPRGWLWLGKDLKQGATRLKNRERKASQGQPGHHPAKRTTAKTPTRSVIPWPPPQRQDRLRRPR